MLCQCDKCGAPTRWYDEKCPRCGAALTVETPTTPIALPNFTTAQQRPDAALAVAPTFLTSQANATEIEETTEKATTQTEETPEEATAQINQTTEEATTETEETTEEATAQTEETPEEATAETEETTEETTAQINQTTEEATAETEETTEETTAQINQTTEEATAETEETTAQINQTTEEATAQIEETTQETTASPMERSQRFDAFWRAVDVWRSTFASETASVTIPRGRAARYALGIFFELFLCPPCAIIAAYFFTRALFADRRAEYYAAMQETEKTRRTLAVGLGVFAAFLCAFIFYVQSQEIALPTEARPTSQLFKN